MKVVADEGREVHKTISKERNRCRHHLSQKVNVDVNVLFFFFAFH